MLFGSFLKTNLILLTFFYKTLPPLPLYDCLVLHIVDTSYASQYPFFLSAFVARNFINFIYVFVMKTFYYIKRSR